MCVPGSGQGITWSQWSCSDHTHILSPPAPVCLIPDQLSPLVIRSHVVDSGIDGSISHRLITPLLSRQALHHTHNSLVRTRQPNGRGCQRTRITCSQSECSCVCERRENRLSVLDDSSPATAAAPAAFQPLLSFRLPFGGKRQQLLRPEAEKLLFPECQTFCQTESRCVFPDSFTRSTPRLPASPSPRVSCVSHTLSHRTSTADYRLASKHPLIPFQVTTQLLTNSSSTLTLV